MEEWRDIKGYEGIYKISSYGRVLSLNYRGQKGLEVILKPQVNTGYIRIPLSKNKIRKHFYVHRLVAEAFIPNPSGLKEINHKDENKTNNHVDNLEYCTRTYNINYGTGRKRAALSISRAMRNNPKICHPVIQFTMDGYMVAEYPSAQEAQRITGIWQSNILCCCKGYSRNSHAGGYKWKFKDCL